MESIAMKRHDEKIVQNDDCVNVVLDQYYGVSAMLMYRAINDRKSHIHKQNYKEHCK